MNSQADPVGQAGLLRDQSLLLQALFSGGDTAQLPDHLQKSGRCAASADRGLQAYRANASALAERALMAAYPVLAQLMGNDNFAPLARTYWHHAPPQRGDVAQWGAALPDFLDASPQLEAEPFLGDVARVEWALHTALTAQDAALDAGSFTLLASGEPEQTSLRLSDGIMTLASAYPVVSIIHAHLQVETTLAQAAALLSDGVAEHALVWRHGFKPKVRLASATEHALVQALQAGVSLDAALTLACSPENEGHVAGFDFNDWLAKAVQTGLVTGAYLLRPVHPTLHHP